MGGSNPPRLRLHPEAQAPTTHRAGNGDIPETFTPLSACQPSGISSTVNVVPVAEPRKEGGDISSLV